MEEGGRRSESERDLRLMHGWLYRWRKVVHEPSKESDNLSVASVSLHLDLLPISPPPSPESSLRPGVKLISSNTSSLINITSVMVCCCGYADYASISNL